MIMVDVLIPSVGRKYNFNLEEEAKIAELIAEITEVICQRENCTLEGKADGLHLCSIEQAKILSAEASLRQYGITYGSQLLLV